MYQQHDEPPGVPTPVPAHWSTGPDRPMPEVTVLDLFDCRVSAEPDAPAGRSDTRFLSYVELDRAATAVAGRLVDAGVPEGARVGVLVERSVDLLIALLAVWKAGAVYTPLDPDHPADRIAHLLADAGAAAVLTRRALTDRVAAGATPVVLLEGEPGEARPARSRRPDDAAYLIYTSGSTGGPKGVEVNHRALVNVVLELDRILRLGPAEHWLTMAPSTFDISLVELSLPLVAGARVTVTSAAQARDAASLVRLIRDTGVTRMQAVPSQWQALLDAGLDAPDLYGMTGGEALTPRLATALTARIRGLVNGYGPTETTVLSTYWTVPAEPGSPTVEQIRIGRPIANTRIHLLDDAGAAVPVGVAGELFIAGTGVAQGYPGDPELTGTVFVADPAGPPGARMYRTGDRARWRTDGHLEYLGRTDSQVKVRGQRVELAEVEAALASLATVGAVVALLRDQELVAYVVPATGAALTAGPVREHAARRLPSAMAPTTVVILDAFPLTPNGKIDRAALRTTPVADPPAADPDSAADPDTAADPFTAEVCTLIEEVLGARNVRPTDDFFDIGGHSLAVMKVAAQFADRWRVEVSSDVFYDTGTVAELAAAVGRLRAQQ
jgi:amino acid adenylation domain-containing protein